ncbi:MAG TPA: AbrB/MazE/SpoVT family DNA-binding domain-containing protein [Thermodesulfobacteriota bacterium]|nr:AbrB/MazE/SpoVT family DNA-binding domain-containing protein [Deltaproteobacteria bacterium]HNR12804.1 AbrB/MazE/SpoVT family DNA-binding domain-containing protein [Thermodesulfobacteriota bacterium]HNU70356.1 AbrB/MazE/SpoVT family DNA-binding domain-containing protein [Thermodesulfobacteriota bacterium]
MEPEKPFTTEIKARGQLTIPKKIRQRGALEEGQTVSIIPLGDSILVTPQRLELDEARRQIRKILKGAQCTLEDVLAGLEDDREELYRETYGKKTR